MSTTIKSLRTEVTLREEDDKVVISTTDFNDEYVSRMVDKFDFIEAVEKELNATVILHDVLPDVKIYDNGTASAFAGSSWLEIDRFKNSRDRNRILSLCDAYTALGIYFRRNTGHDLPTDEQKVGLLARAMVGPPPMLTYTAATEIARRLVQQGVRVEVTE
jgi:hypothetical protein